jgi:hypothetical protein
MKSIPLTQGKVTIVDDEDYEWLSQFKWRFNIRGYATRYITRPRKVELKMHREIMHTPEGKETDHINGDGLDNRKINLRNCSHAENMHNCRKYKTNTSGYKGVSFRADKKRWIACIKVGNKKKQFSRATREEAAQAYDMAARIYYGEFALTNFPLAAIATNKIAPQGES